MGGAPDADLISVAEQGVGATTIIFCAPSRSRAVCAGRQR
jgi:hypothetical protein